MPIMIGCRALRTRFRKSAKQPLPPNVRHINIDNHDVAEVTFIDEQTKKVIERAEMKAKDAMKKVGPGWGGQAGGIIRRNIVGFLGQVAFSYYLFGDFERALEHIAPEFRPDTGDEQYKDYIIDVKTNGRPDGDLMMIPESRFRKHAYDIYVGARLKSENPHKIEIWGYVTRKELENIEPEDFGYGMTIAKPLKTLHPITELNDLPPKNRSRTSK
jgi:hypothetical protein